MKRKLHVELYLPQRTSFGTSNYENRLWGFRYFERTLSVVIRQAWRFVSREFLRDARKVENSGGICSVETGWNILAYAGAECADDNEKMWDKFDIERRDEGWQTANQPYCKWLNIFLGNPDETLSREVLKRLPKCAPIYWFPSQQRH